MKKFYLVIILIITACTEKNSDNYPSVPDNSLIKSITIYSINGQKTLFQTNSYDSQGRIINIQYQRYNQQDTINTKSLFEYTDTTVHVELRDQNNQLMGVKIYHLNENKLAAKETEIVIKNGDTLSQYQLNMRYNENGYLVQMSTDGNTNVLYFYSHNNVDSVHVGSEPIRYNYDRYHLNTIGNVNGGLKFLGKSFFNSCIGTLGSGFLINKYMYEYDSKGRILSVTSEGDHYSPLLDYYTFPYHLSGSRLDYTYY